MARSNSMMCLDVLARSITLMYSAFMAQGFAFEIFHALVRSGFLSSSLFVARSNCMVLSLSLARSDAMMLSLFIARSSGMVLSV